MVGADPFAGALVLGGNIVGRAAAAIKRRKKQKKKVELPEARLRRGVN
jgi:hypothetical protein